MKILQILQTLDPTVGGVAPAVTALSRGLSGRGHNVEILTLDEPNAPWLANTNLIIHALGRGLTSYGYSGRTGHWLDQHRRDYDCVIVNGLWQHLSFVVWQRLAQTTTPYYVFPHGMLDPWFKKQYPLKHLKKWIYWPWAEYRVLRDAAAVIFTSEDEKLQARQSFWLYRCHEKVSPLGIEPYHSAASAKEKFLAQFPALREKRILLFLGRLHPKKGCDLVIESFPPNHPDNANLALVLAGPDQTGWEHELRQRAAQLKLSVPIVFTGMVEGDVKQGAFEAADAFILPSHQENFGMSVAEALRAGLPVLISERVNIWREIAAEGAGYVEKDDLAGTKRLIERWLRMTRDERAMMSENARGCFARHFEINHAADSLLRVLEENKR